MWCCGICRVPADEEGRGSGFAVGRGTMKIVVLSLVAVAIATSAGAVIVPSMDTSVRTYAACVENRSEYCEKQYADDSRARGECDRYAVHYCHCNSIPNKNQICRRAGHCEQKRIADPIHCFRTRCNKKWEHCQDMRSLEGDEVKLTRDEFLNTCGNYYNSLAFLHCD